MQLLAGLQKPTRSYKPVTCYQITKKGMGVVKKISRKDKEIVHEVTYMRGSRELLEAEWDGNDYWLQVRKFCLPRPHALVKAHPSPTPLQ